MARPFRSRGAAAVAIACAIALQAGTAGAVVTQVHEFRVQKDTNADWWVDGFDDGLPPPNSPFNQAFGAAGCQASQPYGCYSVFGSFAADAETGGSLRLDSARGGDTTNALGVARLNQRATLLTNTDSSNTVNGLKRNHDFVVSGIFDLVVPASASSGYGVRLEDRAGSTPISDQVALYVTLDTAGAASIRFQEQDFAAGVRTDIASIGISGTEGQRLRLALAHAASTDLVTASYQFENGGAWGDVQTFAGAAVIFDGELFTRAGFNAFQAPIPEPGSYALMAVGLGMLGWRLRARRTA